MNTYRPHWQPSHSSAWLWPSCLPRLISVPSKGAVQGIPHERHKAVRPPTSPKIVTSPTTSAFPHCHTNGTAQRTTKVEGYSRQSHLLREIGHICRDRAATNAARLDRPIMSPYLTVTYTVVVYPPAYRYQTRAAFWCSRSTSASVYWPYACTRRLRLAIIREKLL